MKRSLLVALFCATVIAAAAEQPNLIFVLADDMGWGDAGFNGQKKIKTPNMDRMAQDGVRFENFYAACSVCGPSRASLMTGYHLGHC
ncbi:MAG: arylsulfatase A, partial [Planctomycetota bacterium]